MLFPRLRRLVRALPMLCVFVCLCVYAQSENPPTTSLEPNYSEEELRILAAAERVESNKAKLEALDAAYKKSSGETSESILLQRLDTYDSLIKELREFTSLVGDYKNGGGTPDHLLGDFNEEMLNTGRSLRADIRTYLSRYNENSIERDTAMADGLRSYIFDNRLLDMGFRLLSEYVAVIEQLEFSAAPSRRFLMSEVPLRADSLSGQIRLNTERLNEAKALLSIKKDDAEVLEKQRLATEKQESDTRSLLLIIDIAEKLELDVSRYRQLLLRTTGEISADLIGSNVLSGLFYDWWISVKQSVGTTLANFSIKAGVFLGILLVFHGIATLVSRVLLRSLTSGSVNLSVLMQDMLTSMTARLIMLLGLLVALAQVGVSLGPVLAGLGVVGFVIGFALQDTLGNFAAGVMILVYRPYDVDDFVEAAGVFGKVRSMNIVSTTVLTFDNQTLIIPNSKIWGDVIKNVTAQKVRRVDMTFGIGYSDDVEHAERILADIVEENEKVLQSPEPMIKLNALGESSVDFIVRPWAKTEHYWDVYWEVTREVKMRFDREGISIPFPQRDVHIYQQSKD
ncbi:mechanosensitive ion channel family protein [Teredinibacter turnerae]|uniref:mechanosensitive ion channel family protein n=1 Tax=Teredinibacter turnerae TaxID=2426 RepID=UPI00036C7ACE|nr:mechanosensitive ion channel family protein [Teredinibacter turnerae]